jgi:hypothetical protein
MSTKKNENTQISTLDDAPYADQSAPVAHVVTGSTHDDALSGDKVNIVIHEQEGDAGREAVFVSVNGVGYQIPRGIVCAVPVEVLHVLDNSVQKIFESLPNGETRERALRRFNHQNHGKA